MSKAIACSEDKRWQAEEDARSLERYAEISGNKARMTAASKILKEKAVATNKALGLTGASAPKPATKPKAPSKKNTDNIRNAMMSGMSKGKK